MRGGAFCAETGAHTGRSPKDKFVVADGHTEKTVWWEKNGRLSPEKFQLLFDDFIAHAKGKTSVRAGPLRRRRPEIPHQDPRLQRACLAFDVHPRAADQAGAR